MVTGVRKERRRRCEDGQSDRRPRQAVPGSPPAGNAGEVTPRNHWVACAKGDRRNGHSGRGESLSECLLFDTSKLKKPVTVYWSVENKWEQHVTCG